MAFDRQIVAITTYCEASSESHEVRRAVVWTIFNRLRLGRYGETAAEVCLRRFQYSEWNGDALDNRNLLRAARVPDGDAVMLDCLAAYDEIVGASPSLDPTGGATHYYDHSIVAPKWASPPAVLTTGLGRFAFYKDVP